MISVWNGSNLDDTVEKDSNLDNSNWKSCKFGQLQLERVQIWMISVWNGSNLDAYNWKGFKFGRFQLERVQIWKVKIGKESTLNDISVLNGSNLDDTVGKGSNLDNSNWKTCKFGCFQLERVQICILLILNFIPEIFYFKYKAQGY